MTSLREFWSAHQTLFTWLGAVSLLMFVGSLVLLPILVARIPEDYFVRDRHAPQSFSQRHWIVSLIGHILKNLFGVILILLGAVMLILPGQGLLTILLGVVLLDFPGKRRFERYLVRRPSILKAVNWMRRRSGHRDLLV